MQQHNVQELQAPHAAPALSGCWKLRAGRAISLQPRQAGVLKIAQGRVWATLNGAHCGHGNESGDHFLQAGQQLTVGAGQHLVLESCAAPDAAPVYFEWGRVPAAGRASRWQAAVPLHDLGLALRQVGQALGQLLKGLAGYGDARLAEQRAVALREF
jgi:hypothetical protein